MNNLFEKAKDFYEKGLWNESQINALVTSGKITKNQAKKILANDENIQQNGE